jgi:hypothetical protein
MTTAPVLSVTVPIMVVVVICALRARLASPRKQVQVNRVIFIATTSSSSGNLREHIPVPHCEMAFHLFKKA